MKKTVRILLIVLVCVLCLAVAVCAASTYSADYILVVNTDLDTEQLSETSITSRAAAAKPSVKEGTSFVDAETGEKIYLRTVEPLAPIPADTDSGEQFAPMPQVRNYAVGNRVSLLDIHGTGTKKTMKCLYSGTYCTVWGSPTEPSATQISSTIAKKIGQEFDSNCVTMTESFGPWFDADGDKKVAIFCHDIESSYKSGNEANVAGYFSGVYMLNTAGRINGVQFQTSDYALGMDCIHIDTYPCMGTKLDQVENVYPTLVHEFQHMIQFSYQVKDGVYKEGLPIFMDEANAMAAEHMLYGPIAYYIDYFGDPEEGYWPGSPLTYWVDLSSDSYANSYLFGQYIRTRYSQLGYGDGHGIYRKMMEEVSATGEDCLTVLGRLLGTTGVQLVKTFWGTIYFGSWSGINAFAGEAWADEMYYLYYPEWDDGEAIYNGGAALYQMNGEPLTVEKKENATMLCLIDGELVEECAEDDSRKELLTSDVDMTLYNDLYPWVVSEGGLQSSNQGILGHTSTLTMTFTTTEKARLRFDAIVSSQEGSDILTITVDGVTRTMDGEDTYAYSRVLAAGDHTVKFRYEKDDEGRSGADCARIESFDLSYIPIEGTCGDDARWVYDKQTGILSITGSGAMYDYSVSIDATPEQIVPWEEYQKEITRVEIGRGITYIGAHAFDRFSAMTEVSIPDTVTGIGENAFQSCTVLSEVTLPDSLTSIGRAVFNMCKALKRITWPASLTEVPEAAFKSCEALEQVTFLGDVTTIGRQAFYRCVALTSITIPDTVTSIEWVAFKDCTALQTVYLGSGVQMIEDAAFSGCTALTDVYYNGPKTRWESIDIVRTNSSLTDATIHYNETVTVEMFEMAGSNMTLGNELEVNFLLKKTDLKKTGCTAVITHERADGTTRVLQTAQADWKEMGIYHKVSIRIAAKEMADPLSIEIFDAEGHVLNEPYTSSVRDYAGRALGASTTAARVKTMMVDMLNYGAAAQRHFGYNTADLANGTLTAAQKKLATATVICTDSQVKGANCYGANLSLEDSIQLNVMFKGLKNKDLSKMYAVISFSDYCGETGAFVVYGNKFVKYTADVYKVVVDQIVLADAEQLVCVTVYNADGSVYGSAVDSVESYVARALANSADTYGLYANIMKFATSARIYLTKG